MCEVVNTLTGLLRLAVSSIGTKPETEASDTERKTGALYVDCRASTTHEAIYFPELLNRSGSDPIWGTSQVR